MEYAVYADLSRRLAEHERTALFKALEASVPGSGCVGIQKGPTDEVYFSLVTPSKEEASAQAAHYMNLILQIAALDIEHEITLQGM